MIGTLAEAGAEQGTERQEDSGHTVVERQGPGSEPGTTADTAVAVEQAEVNEQVHMTGEEGPVERKQARVKLAVAEDKPEPEPVEVVGADTVVEVEIVVEAVLLVTGLLGWTGTVAVML